MTYQPSVDSYHCGDVMRLAFVIIPLMIGRLLPVGHVVAHERSERIAEMEKIADLALVPPSLNTSPLPEYDYDKLDYGMTIGIERTPGGRLWACWVAGGDSPKAFFVLATSDDDGATWSKPRLVVDAHADALPRPRSILVGNLWTDPLGRLWLIFDQSMDMFDGRAGVWVANCDDPDAKTPKWSAPRRIWHGVTLNKPTVLSTGQWMMPISLDQRGGFGPFNACFTELDPLRGPTYSFRLIRESRGNVAVACSFQIPTGTSTWSLNERTTHSGCWLGQPEASWRASHWTAGKPGQNRRLRPSNTR